VRAGGIEPPNREPIPRREKLSLFTTALAKKGNKGQSLIP